MIAGAPPAAPRILPIILGALIATSILIALSLLVALELQRVDIARALVGSSFEKRRTEEVLLTHVYTAESALRGYVITHDRAFMARYVPARDAAARQLAVLTRLYADDPVQTALIGRLRGAVAAKFAGMAEAIRWCETGSTARAAAWVSEGRGRLLMEQAHLLVARSIAEEDRRRVRHIARAQRQAHLSSALAWLVLAIAALSAGIALCLSWRDARLRHRADIRTYEALARFRALFAGTSDAIVVVGPDGAIEEVNATADRLLGHPAGALVGRDIAEVIDIAGGEGAFAQRIGIVGDRIEQPLRPDRSARHAGGYAVPVDISLGLVPLADGLRVVAMLRDISERRAAEAVKDAFVATVSHELRTPLTSVIGALGLLRGGTAGELPEAARRLVGIAENNSRRLIRLINDILDIDRIGSGFGTMDKADVDLAVLAARAINDAQGLAAPRGIAIRLETPPAGGAPVCADAERMLQVIGNLLANAIRFSPERGTIRVAVTVQDRRAILYVEDCGPGVPADFRNHLFTRFAQSAAGAAIPGGSGLGLAISREIVRAHDGEIWLEDGARGGALFCVALALRTFMPAPEPGSRPRILVCEDDPDLAQVLRDLVEAHGYAADVCGTVREAQVQAQAGGHAGILLDLVLPDAGGLAAIRALRALPETRSLPVIVVSAFASDSGSDPGAHALDVIDWIDKPVDPRRLVAALERAIDRSHPTIPTLLHIDDDPDMLEVTAFALGEHGRVLAATTIAEARDLLAREAIDVVILDIGLAEGSGLELLPDLFAADGAALPTIIYSATDTMRASDPRFDRVLVKSRRSLSALSGEIGKILARRHDRAAP